MAAYRASADAAHRNGSGTAAPPNARPMRGCVCVSLSLSLSVWVCLTRTLDGCARLRQGRCGRGTGTGQRRGRGKPSQTGWTLWTTRHSCAATTHTSVSVQWPCSTCARLVLSTSSASVRTPALHRPPHRMYVSVPVHGRCAHLGDGRPCVRVRRLNLDRPSLSLSLSLSPCAQWHGCWPRPRRPVCVSCARPWWAHKRTPMAAQRRRRRPIIYACGCPTRALSRCCGRVRWFWPSVRTCARWPSCSASTYPS
jgi:hypothetical protein